MEFTSIDIIMVCASFYSFDDVPLSFMHALSIAKSRGGGSGARYYVYQRMAQYMMVS